MMIDNVLTMTTTINLDEYAGEHNGYDKTKLHPMKHTICIVSDNQTKINSILVGQLEIILELINKYPNVGRAIDHLYNGVDKG